MSKPITARKTVVTAIVAALMIGTTGTALAQRSVEERRAARQEQQQRGSKAVAAEARYPQATRQAPDARPSSRGGPKLQRLFKAYEETDLAAAIPIAEDIIADDRANSYDKAMAARLIGALQIGNDDAAARASLQRALEFNGLNNNDHYESMLILAQLQLQDDQYEEGLTTLDQLQRETNAQLPEHQALRGNALYRLERYPEAIAALQSAVAADQQRSEWTQLLMAAYAEAGQSQEAVKLAEQIAASAPSDKQSQMNLAVVYMQSGQDQKAAEVLQKLRASGQLTEERDYRNLMALLLGSENQEREAIIVINEGLEKNILKPDHQTYVALAQAYYFSDQIGPSIDAYRKAAPLAGDGETYLNLARVLHGEGRLAEAKQAAQQALDKGVKSPQDANRILQQR